jgi:hypothetical protein
VRFVTLGSSEAANNRRTDEVIATINAAGEAFFSGTTWQGRRAMRISVCDWRTSWKDVERALKSVASVLNSATLQFR